jgi:hypothetical protein
LAAGILCALAAAGHAQTKPEAFSDQEQILKRFPKETSLVRHGARVLLKTGGWVDLTDNPFGKSAPTLCWYVPSMHVAGLCQNGPGVTVTTLVELNTGRRLSAPGLPTLMPEAGLVAIGPDKAKGIEADSLTLMQVKADDIVDEGGALFDDDYGPGGWVDGDCYRLTPKAGKGGAWLEKAADGWSQVTDADSKVCQGRHGR